MGGKDLAAPQVEGKVAISTVQQGLITESEFVKIVIITSGGLLVPERPLADDERRDFDIRIRRHFREYLGIQEKTSLTLRRHGRARVLQINFRRRPPMDSDADYWYFLGHFDLPTMTFSEPLFLVPSEFLHKHARNGTRGGAVQFQFKASMEPGSRDRWAQFRLSREELGRRILELLQAQQASRAARATARPSELPGLLWVTSPDARRSMPQAA